MRYEGYYEIYEISGHLYRVVKYVVLKYTVTEWAGIYNSHRTSITVARARVILILLWRRARVILILLWRAPQ